MTSVMVPDFLTATKHLVEGFNSRFDQLRLHICAAGAGHDPREHDDAVALPDSHVVVSVGDGDASHLAHLDAATHGAILLERLVEADHAMGDALDFFTVVIAAAGLCVEQECDDPAPGQEGLEADELTSKARRVAGDQSDLKERVVHQSMRLVLLDRALDRLPGFIQPKFRGLENRLIGGPIHRLRGRELLDANSFKSPSM